MIFKSESPQGDLNGFIDAGSQVQGELRFKTAFRVDGRLEGSVVSQGHLVVGDGGEVEGDVRAGEVFISGIVRGRVIASERVRITPSGKVFGDLETPALVIEEGAVFQGHCVMGDDDRRSRSSSSSPRPGSNQGSNQGPKPAPKTAEGASAVVKPIQARQERGQG